MKETLKNEIRYLLINMLADGMGEDVGKAILNHYKSTDPIEFFQTHEIRGMEDILDCLAFLNRYLETKKKPLILYPTLSKIRQALISWELDTMKTEIDDYISFQKKLDAHDVYYNYSDDFQAYRKGLAEHNDIIKSIGDSFVKQELYRRFTAKSFLKDKAEAK
jgi:hypothetical protein